MKILSAQEAAQLTNDIIETQTYYIWENGHYLKEDVFSLAYGAHLYDKSGHPKIGIHRGATLNFAIYYCELWMERNGQL